MNPQHAPSAKDTHSTTEHTERDAMNKHKQAAHQGATNAHKASQHWHQVAVNAHAALRAYLTRLAGLAQATHPQ